MDDEPAIRTLAVNMLAYLGHDAEAASDGISAVERYRRALGTARSFDAVILDLTGKAWATLDMLECICSADWTLPIVAFVQPGDDLARRHASDLGAAAVLELPVKADVMCAEVRSLVQASPTRGAA